MQLGGERGIYAKMQPGKFAPGSDTKQIATLRTYTGWPKNWNIIFVRLNFIPNINQLSKFKIQIVVISVILGLTEPISLLLSRIAM